MRTPALFIAFTTLAIATTAVSDQLCRFHLTDKDCTAWATANYPTDDALPSVNVTQTTSVPSGITNSRLKSAIQTVSICVQFMGNGPNIISLAMDTNACTRGNTSAGPDVELAHFNVLVLFSDQGCNFGPSNALQPLAMKQDRGKWANRCWTKLEGWKAFALAYMDPKEL